MPFSLIPPVYAQSQPIGKVECFGAFCPADISQVDVIFTLVFGFLTIVGGLAFLIWFIIGGLSWLTGGGDKAKVDAAKQSMTNAAIGMIIIVAAYGIAYVVGSFLGVEILNPAQLVGEL